MSVKQGEVRVEGAVGGCKESCERGDDGKSISKKLEGHCVSDPPAYVTFEVFKCRGKLYGFTIQEIHV